MQPIIIRNSKVPVMLSIFVDIAAITLFPFIFIRKGQDSERIVRHETIHYHQYLETAVIGFLVLYLFDWLKALLKYRDTNRAYLQIRFEQEAYAHEENETYLAEREPFAWRRFSV